jgi:hypothetical protein
MAADVTNLKCDQLVVDHDLFRQKVSANGGFVLVIVAAVDILIHQGCLSDTKTNFESDSNWPNSTHVKYIKDTYPLSPKIMIFNRTFFLVAMIDKN